MRRMVPGRACDVKPSWRQARAVGLAQICHRMVADLAGPLGAKGQPLSSPLVASPLLPSFARSVT